MYLSSPARMRLALGPGSAVFSLGPAVKVFAVMESSKVVLSSLFSESVGPKVAHRYIGGLGLELKANSERRYAISEAKDKERKLVAKEIGAHTRRQYGKIPARTSASLNPARPQKRNVTLRAHSSKYSISCLTTRRNPLKRTKVCSIFVIANGQAWRRGSLQRGPSFARLGPFDFAQGRLARRPSHTSLTANVPTSALRPMFRPLQRVSVARPIRSLRLK